MCGITTPLTPSVTAGRPAGTRHADPPHVHTDELHLSDRRRPQLPNKPGLRAHFPTPSFSSEAELTRGRGFILPTAPSPRQPRPPPLLLPWKWLSASSSASRNVQLCDSVFMVAVISRLHPGWAAPPMFHPYSGRTLSCAYHDSVA